MVRADLCKVKCCSRGKERTGTHVFDARVLFLPGSPSAQDVGLAQRRQLGSGVSPQAAWICMSPPTGPCLALYSPALPETKPPPSQWHQVLPGCSVTRVLGYSGTYVVKAGRSPLHSYSSRHNANSRCFKCCLAVLFEAVT